MDLSRIKAMRKGLVLASGLELISGLFMIVFSANSLNMMVKILGIVAVTYGVVTFFMWLVKRDRKPDPHKPYNEPPHGKNETVSAIVTSVLGVVAGGCFIFLSDSIMGIFTMAAGIFAGVFGVLKLPRMFELKKAGFKKWFLMLIPFAIIVGLGIFIGLNAFGTGFEKTASVLLGIALIVGCGADIVAMAGVADVEKHFGTAPEVDAEQVEVDTDFKEEK